MRTFIPFKGGGSAYRKYDATTCPHRWSNQKKFAEGHDWFVIRRCRWCDTWERIKIVLTTAAKPALVRERFVESKNELSYDERDKAEMGLGAVVQNQDVPGS